MKPFPKLLLISAVLTPALLCADPAAHVPASADAAIYVRASKLKANPALARLAESGELARFEKSMRALGVTPDAFVAAFFGLEGRAVFADVPAQSEVFAKLNAKYKNNQSYEVREGAINGHKSVTMIFYLPPRKPYHSLFEAVWLSADCAAFGDDDYPLPQKELFVPPTCVEYAQLSAPGTLAAAFIPDPAKFGFDVMGLASQLKNIRLSARETNDGVFFAGSAEARDVKTLPQTAQLFSNTMRIFLVAFFGNSQTLCQNLMQKVEIHTAENRIDVRLMLDKDTLIAIQKYYDAHSAQIRKTLENNVQKTK